MAASCLILLLCLSCTMATQPICQQYNPDDYRVNLTFYQCFKGPSGCCVPMDNACCVSATEASTTWYLNLLVGCCISNCDRIFLAHHTFSIAPLPSAWVDTGAATNVHQVASKAMSRASFPRPRQQNSIKPSTDHGRFYR